MRRFGFQFTFFRVGLLPESPGFASDWTARDAVMAHASVVDLDAGEHRFSELLHRAVPELGGFPGFSGDAAPGDLLAWARAPAGTDTVWTLRWNGGAFDLEARDDATGIGLDLSTHPGKPLVLQGPNGYSRKGLPSDAASLYYSFTRLATHGTLTLAGKAWAVRGVSWMDKEFGSGVLAEHQSGWDWFSLRLEDGRDVMLYLLRDRENRVDFARGTLISASGEVRILEGSDFRVRATATWRSEQTSAVYPARWEISIPDARPAIEVEVRPEVADQENRGRLAGGLFYWEGAVGVRTRTGAACGEGYVELTGYGTRNRPAL